MPTSHHAIVRTLAANLWSKLPVRYNRRYIAHPGTHKCSYTTSNGHSIDQSPTVHDLHIPLPSKSNTFAAHIPQDADHHSPNLIHPSRRPGRKGREKMRHAAKNSKPEEAVRPDSGVLQADTSRIRRVRPPSQAKVARLRHTLHRVLFSPGVHFIRDPRTGTRNFEATLEDIPSPEDFAFHRCPSYVTPSQDTHLADLASRVGCRFIGSTSSLTQGLSQIYFALSGGKGINTTNMSMDFLNERTDFTAGAALPASLVLRPMGDDGKVLAIDSDKSWDVDNVLSDYGRVLEKVLTSEAGDFKRFLNSSPESAVSDAERNEREAYSYCRTGSLLMRSQLDCRDQRLPGSGVFDIKTRAVFPIRHDRANYQANSVWDIARERGLGATFERELYDLARSGMLKYSMQARIGGMDGVFCAYHNTKRLLGFQYLPLVEMDQKIFGSAEIGDLTFQFCAHLFESVLKYITYELATPEPISIIMRHVNHNNVDIVFYPTSDPVTKQGVRLNLVNLIEGAEKPGQLQLDEANDISKIWQVKWRLSPLTTEAADTIVTSTKKVLGSMAVLSVPEGKTVEEMAEAQASGEKSTALQWKAADRYIMRIREEAKKNGMAYEARKKTWKTWKPDRTTRAEREESA